MKNKTALAILGTLLATAVGVPLLLRKKEVPPPEAPITITILDAQGKPVPRTSPVTLTEGASYTARITARNTSTKAGTPWAATLGVGISGSTAVRQLIAAQIKQVNFAADEAKAFDFPFSLPMGSGGESGEITAWVQDPTGKAISSAREPLTIAEVPVIYSATIVIG